MGRDVFFDPFASLSAEDQFLSLAAAIAVASARISHGPGRLP
jgi:hypothetical protein